MKRPNQQLPGSTKTMPESEPGKPFLVIVRDDADATYSYGVVRAPDEESAERQAVDAPKEDHGLGDLNDEEAGFEAVATFSRDDLVYWLGEMDAE